MKLPISLDLIQHMSSHERTLVRALLILLWKEIFALPDTCETHAALDKIEDLMSALDPDMTENVLDIDLSQCPILVEELDSAAAALLLTNKKGPAS